MESRTGVQVKSARGRTVRHQREGELVADVLVGGQRLMGLEQYPLGVRRGGAPWRRFPLRRDQAGRPLPWPRSVWRRVRTRSATGPLLGGRSHRHSCHVAFVATDGHRPWPILWFTGVYGSKSYVAVPLTPPTLTAMVSESTLPVKPGDQPPPALSQIPPATGCPAT